MLCTCCRLFYCLCIQLIDHCPFDVILQLAKLAGNKVVATCGGQDKAELLQSLGADRVIDYKKETIKSVNEHSNLNKHISCFVCLKRTNGR
jgi:NADPH:quinone reductase-like Zn-dependent oxidoreductase